MKNVIMVDSSDVSVPRGPRRQRLHEAGMVVSFMEFNTLWKEDVVIQTIENAFKNVLDESQSHPVNATITHAYATYYCRVCS